jgi:hypothetical protein
MQIANKNVEVTIINNHKTTAERFRRAIKAISKRNKSGCKVIANMLGKDCKEIAKRGKAIAKQP